MTPAIRELQRSFLTPAQVEASFEIMGLDTQLIDDRTYFVVCSSRDPSHTREGIGRLVLATCEDAARSDGFTTVELGGDAIGRTALPSMRLRSS